MADALDNRRKKEPPVRRMPGMKVAPPPKDASKEALLDAFQRATPEERRELRKFLGQVRRKHSKEA